MTIIGLEVHVQLENCNSKLFCSCSTKKAKRPNTHTCPICLGMPGSKPALNKKAALSALKTALALKCKINQEYFFSRKTYFFPDLAKNFQITQFETPIGEEGKFGEVDIKRLHLEEDPASLIHKETNVLVDYNRSGIPLIEVVTEPQIKSARDARMFVQQLTTVMEYLGIYTKKSEASLRCDVNVSVSKGDRVEIKNIGSAYDVEHALIHEIKIQEKNPAKVQQTKGWDTVKKKTYLQREKESEDDYGYIVEPDIPKFVVTDDDIKKLTSESPTLASDRIDFYVKKYKISKEDAKTIVSSRDISDLFERVAREVDPKFAAKWIRRELSRVLKYKKLELKDTKITSRHLIDLIKAIDKKVITVRVGQKIMEDLVKKPFDVKTRVKDVGKVDNQDLESICKKVIKANPKVVQDFKAGERKALNFLIGQVMRETKGTSDPNSVSKVMKKCIK